MTSLRLGLIGGNITQTRSPTLHIACGLSVGRNVTYDLLIPQEQDLDLAQMLNRCEAAGFAGVNVTYPYKEAAIALATPGEEQIAAICSANTILFTPSGRLAYNTDHSGFIAAFRSRFGDLEAGRVLVLGSGGVGRAVVFALAALGAAVIQIHDTDTAKAKLLAEGAGRSFPACTFTVAPPPPSGRLEGFDAVVNCTPIGMAGRSGTPLEMELSGRLSWAFDAVYTPEHTQFRGQMEQLGAQFLSGWELYFHQGIQAFELFSGEKPDAEWVRKTITHRR